MSEIRKLPEGRIAPVTNLSPPAPASTVAEAPQTALLDNAADRAPEKSVEEKAPRNLRRAALLYGVPVLIALLSTIAYLHGGRYIDTNNAYVKADKATITAEVSGKIVEVDVVENQRVAQGQVLFRVDDTPYKLALSRADAALAQTAQDLAALKLQYKQALSEIELAKTNVAFARITFNRQSGLLERHIGSVADRDDAQHMLDTAMTQLDLAQQRAAKTLVDLNGDANAAVEDYPRYQQAKSDRDTAALDLERTAVTAPFSGVASKKPELGTYVERGSPVMSVVSDGDVWVEANFKETDLTYMRPGQNVEVQIDTYPGREWRGTVQSLSEATGSEFALLPAQNATGNWVKVVQRVAVRIALDRSADDPPLRAGMSATVTVDTGHKRTWRDLLPG